jgi:hypothetical protein
MSWDVVVYGPGEVPAGRARRVNHSIKLLLVEEAGDALEVRSGRD